MLWLDIFNTFLNDLKPKNNIHLDGNGKSKKKNT